MSRIFVRVCAVLIAIRALTNLAKLSQGNEAILVFFGQILRGGDAAIPALGVGLFMLVTAIAMWKPARWAVPLIATYAVYVPVNIVLWILSNPEELRRVGTQLSSATDPTQLQLVGALGIVIYALVAIGTTAGPAWLLWKQRVRHG